MIFTSSAKANKAARNFISAGYTVTMYRERSPRTGYIYVVIAVKG
jgi:hypothetical protein